MEHKQKNLARDKLKKTLYQMSQDFDIQKN